MAGETSMREVVERLRAEGSDAVPELQEFDQALKALLQNLHDVEPTFREIHLATTKVFGSGSEYASAWSEVKDQTSRLVMWHTQFLAGFKELQSAVRAWSIADAGRHSGSPGSDKLPPKD